MISVLRTKIKLGVKPQPRQKNVNGVKMVLIVLKKYATLIQTIQTLNFAEIIVIRIQLKHGAKRQLKLIYVTGTLPNALRNNALKMKH